MLEKICLCFTWPGHHRRGDAFFVEGFDEARQFAQREPVDADVLVPGGPSSISGSVSSRMAATDTARPCARAASSSRRRKAAVAGDEAKLHS